MALGEHVLLALGHEVEAMDALLNPKLTLDECLAPALNSEFKNPNAEEEEDDDDDDEEASASSTIKLNSKQKAVLMGIARDLEAQGSADLSNPNALCQAIFTQAQEIAGQEADEDEAKETDEIKTKRQVCADLEPILRDDANKGTLKKKLSDVIQRQQTRLGRRFYNETQLQNMAEQYAARASVLEAKVEDVEKLLMVACGRNQTGCTLEEKLQYFLSQITFETTNEDGELSYRILNPQEKEYLLATLKEAPPNCDDATWLDAKP